MRARRAFSAFGYDGAGVRNIAAGARVSAMLINRYFGSTERLFAEVAMDVMRTPVLLTREFICAGYQSDAMARALMAMTSPRAAPLDGFLIVLRSATSARAAAIERKQIHAHHSRPWRWQSRAATSTSGLVARCGSPDGAARAWPKVPHVS